MDDDTCWQCGGDGHLGSACVDDCCHGGDVPCYHGDEDVIPCDVCRGKGRISYGDDDDEDGDGDGFAVTESDTESDEEGEHV